MHETLSFLNELVMQIYFNETAFQKHQKVDLEMCTESIPDITHNRCHTLKIENNPYCQN